ncbi:hypothetical protein JCM10207_006845 [Rhodosporidiobolus poonsookiae]
MIAPAVQLWPDTRGKISSRTPHACAVCGKRYSRAEFARRHWAVKHAPQTYPCPLCAHTTSTWPDLVSHVHASHPEHEPHSLPDEPVCPAPIPIPVAASASAGAAPRARGAARKRPAPSSFEEEEGEVEGGETSSARSSSASLDAAPSVPAARLVQPRQSLYRAAPPAGANQAGGDDDLAPRVAPAPAAQRRKLAPSLCTQPALQPGPGPGLEAHPSPPVLYRLQAPPPPPPHSSVHPHPPRAFTPCAAPQQLYTPLYAVGAVPLARGAARKRPANEDEDGEREREGGETSSARLSSASLDAVPSAPVVLPAQFRPTLHRAVPAANYPDAERRQLDPASFRPHPASHDAAHEARYSPPVLYPAQHHPQPEAQAQMQEHPPLPPPPQPFSRLPCTVPHDPLLPGLPFPSPPYAACPLGQGGAYDPLNPSAATPYAAYARPPYAPPAPAEVSAPYSPATTTTTTAAAAVWPAFDTRPHYSGPFYTPPVAAPAPTTTAAVCSARLDWTATSTVAQRYAAETVLYSPLAPAIHRARPLPRLNSLFSCGNHYSRAEFARRHWAVKHEEARRTAPVPGGRLASARSTSPEENRDPAPAPAPVPARPTVNITAAADDLAPRVAALAHRRQLAPTFRSSSPRNNSYSSYNTHEPPSAGVDSPYSSLPRLQAPASIPGPPPSHPFVCPPRAASYYSPALRYSPTTSAAGGTYAYPYPSYPSSTSSAHRAAFLSGASAASRAPPASYLHHDSCHAARFPEFGPDRRPHCTGPYNPSPVSASTSGSAGSRFDWTSATSASSTDAAPGTALTSTAVSYSPHAPAIYVPPPAVSAPTSYASCPTRPASFAPRNPMTSCDTASEVTGDEETSAGVEALSEYAAWAGQVVQGASGGEGGWSGAWDEGQETAWGM